MRASVVRRHHPGVAKGVGAVTAAMAEEEAKQTENVTEAAPGVVDMKVVSWVRLSRKEHAESSTLEVYLSDALFLPKQEKTKTFRC